MPACDPCHWLRNAGGNWPSRGGSLGSDTPGAKQQGMGLEGGQGLPQGASYLLQGWGADREWGSLAKAGCNKENHAAAGHSPSYQEVWAALSSSFSYLLIN